MLFVTASAMVGTTANAQKVATATVNFSIDRIAVIDAQVAGDHGVRLLWTTNLDLQDLEVAVSNPPAGLEAVEITSAGTFGEHRSLEVSPTLVAGPGTRKFGTVSRSAGGVNLRILLRWSAQARQEPVSLQFSMPGTPQAAATVVVR